MRIAHISDLHILDLKGIRPWRYLGKRLTGGLNLLTRRRKEHSPDAVRQAVRQILDEDGADHIVVTGDLTNLALESEFQAARTLLAEHAGGPDRLSVIPGNHDDYTLNASRVRRFERFFAPWARTDLPSDTTHDGVFPYAKLLSDHVALVGLDTGIASPPVYAVGRVGDAQRAALDDLLAHSALRDRFVVVALHHHLVPPARLKPGRREKRRRLIDADAVLDILKRHRVPLAIHGHTHQFGFTELNHPGADTLLRICETGSTSTVRFHDDHFGGKYTLYDIDTDAPTPRLSRITTRLYDPQTERFTPWHERCLTPTTHTVVNPDHHDTGWRPEVTGA